MWTYYSDQSNMTNSSHQTQNSHLSSVDLSLPQAQWGHRTDYYSWVTKTLFKWTALSHQATWSLHGDCTNCAIFQ